MKICYKSELWDPQAPTGNSSKKRVRFGEVTEFPLRRGSMTKGKKVITFSCSLLQRMTMNHKSKTWGCEGHLLGRSSHKCWIQQHWTGLWTLLILETQNGYPHILHRRGRNYKPRLMDGQWRGVVADCCNNEVKVKSTTCLIIIFTTVIIYWTLLIIFLAVFDRHDASCLSSYWRTLY